MLPLSRRTQPFRESVIREMTRIGAEVGGVDLAQGLPNFDPPPELVEALTRLVHDAGAHQYSFTWGSPAFRAAIAEKYARVNRMCVDPETEVTVTCGVSEALAATVLALTEPGDEVVLVEPFYENYVPACVLGGAVPRFAALDPVTGALDAERLAGVMTSKTRLLVLNTPGNPSGRVFTRAELDAVAALCERTGVVAVVDEIYERMTYDGHEHVSLASLPAMEGRTVTLSGLGKTYAVTGWRVGWAVAAPPLTALIRKVHDYLTVCAPTLFQEAGRVALALPESYDDEMRAKYAARKALLLPFLAEAGFSFREPEGAYYVMVDAAPLGWTGDAAFVDFLARKVGVIAVPGSSFYAGAGGGTKARLNFAKKDETLREAGRRLTASSLRPPPLLSSPVPTER
jgi:aminotransferase